MHPVQPRCLGITNLLINTCMLDTLPVWGPYNVYFCHVWFQSMQWFFCNIFQKGPILNSIPRVKTMFKLYSRARVAQCVRLLDYLTTHTSLSQIQRGFAPGCVNNKKGALDSKSHVIKFTSCLAMVGGSLRVLWLFPLLKLIAMI